MYIYRNQCAFTGTIILYAVTVLVFVQHVICIACIVFVTVQYVRSEVVVSWWCSYYCTTTNYSVGVESNRVESDRVEYQYQYSMVGTSYTVYIMYYLQLVIEKSSVYTQISLLLFGMRILLLKFNCTSYGNKKVHILQYIYIMYAVIIIIIRLVLYYYIYSQYLFSMIYIILFIYITIFVPIFPSLLFIRCRPFLGVCVKYIMGRFRRSFFVQIRSTYLTFTERYNPFPYDRNLPIICSMTTAPTKDRLAIKTVVGPI